MDRCGFLERMDIVIKSTPPVDVLFAYMRANPRPANTPVQMADKIKLPEYTGNRGATASIRKDEMISVLRERRKKRMPRKKKDIIAIGIFRSKVVIPMGKLNKW